MSDQFPTDPTTAELKPQNVWFDKKHIITYVIIVIGLAVIACAVYAYQKSNPKTTFVPQYDSKLDCYQVEDVCASVVSPDGTNITNWKIYTNSQYGFSFKYPNSLSPYGISTNNKFPFTAESTNMIITVSNVNIPYSGATTVSNIGLGANPKTFSIGNQTGLETTSTDSGNCAEFFYTKLGSDQTMVILLEQKPCINSFDPNQILSTFKFTQ